MLIQIFNTDFELVNLLLFPKNLGHTFDSKIQMIVTSETSTCEKKNCLQKQRRHFLR